MRRLILVAAILALIGAGTAMAWDNQGQGKTVSSTSATFTATTGGNVRTDTCTGSDGDTYAVTHGTWTGTATSTDASLNGTATVDADALVNTTTGYGTVSGRLKIDTSSGHTSADFDAVDTNGQLAGLAEGHGSASWSQLVADLSATWSATAGFTNGSLGGSTAMTGNAVEVTSGNCQPAQTPKPETIDVRGAVTAVSSTSISAAGVTCVVPSTLATVVGALTVGGRIDMKCVAASGTNTLVSINADNGGGQGHGNSWHGKRHR